MNLVERAQKILLQPKQEWYVIQQEPTTPAQLYPGYIIPLAAIGPVASIIGLAIVGVPTVLGNYRISIPYAVIIAIIAFALELASVYVVGLVIDALAPSFASHKNFFQAFKVATYCRTPAWIGGIFSLIPSLGLLGALLGLYGIYLLYLGLPPLMYTPPDKAVGYTAVVIVVMIVLFIIIGAIIGAITTALLTSVRAF
ncbi:MAG TPA: Yip1 family protein [Blastocatellia bacterium]|nr:Yip1 family protein [Blastocatellia bacterium]